MLIYEVANGELYTGAGYHLGRFTACDCKSVHHHT